MDKTPSVCPDSVASGSVVEDLKSQSFSTGLLSSPEADHDTRAVVGKHGQAGRGCKRGRE